jgi:hypothetical protein
VGRAQPEQRPMVRLPHNRQAFRRGRRILFRMGEGNRADRNENDLWIVGIGKRGGFLDPMFQILPFDPIVGDETGCFPAGVPLRSEGSHPMRVFGCPERL